MSKPISFGFGKSKPTGAPKFSLPQGAPKQKPVNGRSNLHDSDHEDEEEPKHESVTGFSSEGIILSKPVQDQNERVIKNAGNGDWRTRGKNLLRADVQAARNGEVVMVEKDEVSKASGLQFAGPKDASQATNGDAAREQSVAGEPPRSLTEDEAALAALLDDGSGRPKSNAIIQQKTNSALRAQDETSDFRADVATRPESSTLDEYAAMPVEEFGLAMLRGMGKKRRANGELINLTEDKKEEPKKRKQEGFLGIGAKAAPGAELELGAWGKADMRKNQKGEGFFIPLMRVNEKTGEKMTEEELQQRLKGSKSGRAEEDWRDRRDRNLERSGRDKKNGDHKMLTNGDDYRDQMNDFSRTSSSSRRDRDDREHESSRSRRDKDQDDRDYDSSRSRRDRSRSKERRPRDDDRHDSRHRDRHKDKYRDDDRYDSSSSHRSRHRDGDEERRRRDRS